jgi:hypothetical protein
VDVDDPARVAVLVVLVAVAARGPLLARAPRRRHRRQWRKGPLREHGGHDHRDLLPAAEPLELVLAEIRHRKGQDPGPRLSSEELLESRHESGVRG